MNNVSGTEGDPKDSFQAATGSVDFEVINSAASSWKGDIAGYDKVIETIGRKYNLFSISEGEVTNFSEISRQIMGGILDVGWNNPNVADVFKTLVGNAVSAVDIKQYLELAKENDLQGQSILVSGAITKSLRDYNLDRYDGFIGADIRNAVEIELRKQVPEKPQPAVAATNLNTQEEQDEEKKQEKKKEDKKEEDKSEEKDPNEKVENDVENEFEEDIRKDKPDSKKKESEGESDGDGDNPHDPKDRKKPDKNKEEGNNTDKDLEESKKTNEAEQGQTKQPKSEQNEVKDPNSSDYPENSAEQSSFEGDKGKTKSESGGESKTDAKTDTTKLENRSNQPTSKNQVSEPGGGSNGPNSKDYSKPSNTGQQGPQNTGQGGKISSDVRTTSNQAPGNGKLKPGSATSSNPLPGNTGGNASPTGFTNHGPLNPKQIKNLKPSSSQALNGAGKLNKLGSNAGSNLAKKVAKTGQGLAKNAGKETAKVAANVGSKAVQASTKAASALTNLAVRGVALIGQSIAGALAAAGPVIVIVVVIVAVVLGILFTIMAIACPGKNPFAQKTEEILGKDKLAFNNKLDPACRSTKNNSDGCNTAPASGNYGKGDGKITPEQCAKAKEFWPLFQKAGSTYGVDPYILAGIALRESSFTFTLSNKSCSGTGDSGHGHGIMQIDDGSHMAYLILGTWGDCESNINYAASLFKSIMQSFPNAGLRQQLNSYNAGSPCSDGTDSCTTDSYGTGTLVDIANAKNCLTGVNIPVPSTTTAKIESTSQNFLAFNPFGSVGVKAQSSLPIDAWLPPGNSFDIDRDSDFRNTKKFVVLDSSGGVDFTLAPPGKSYEESRNVPIVAHLAGEVTYIDNPGPQYEAGSYGNIVAVYYPSINKTIAYAHLETVDVKPGDAISPGSLLGRQGSSGSAPKNYVHVDFRIFDGKIEGAGVQNSDLAIDRNKTKSQAVEEYSQIFSDVLTYYNANSSKIAASNFSATAANSRSSSKDPCPPGSKSGSGAPLAGIIKAKGSLSLLEAAKRYALGPEGATNGQCWKKVADYIVESGGFGKVDGLSNYPLTQAAINAAGGLGSLSELSATTQGLYWNENLAALGLRNLVNDNPNASPFNAPAGSIVVVAAGYGNSQNPAGDIAVADGSGNGIFYNDGVMSYGTPETWKNGYSVRGTGPGTPLVGSGKLIGIYVPI